MTDRLILRTAATIHCLSTSSQVSSASIPSLSAAAAENSSDKNRCTYRARDRQTHRQTGRRIETKRWRILRERDDDEIEPVPCVTEICKASHDETTRQHLDGAFHRVYSSEYLPTHGIRQTQWNCNWSSGTYWKTGVGNYRKHPQITLLYQLFCALCMHRFHLFNFQSISSTSVYPYSESQLSYFQCILPLCCAVFSVLWSNRRRRSVNCSCGSGQ